MPAPNRVNSGAGYRSTGGKPAHNSVKGGSVGRIRSGRVKFARNLAVGVTTGAVVGTAAGTFIGRRYKRDSRGRFAS